MKDRSTRSRISLQFLIAITMALVFSNISMTQENDDEEVNREATGLPIKEVNKAIDLISGIFGGGSDDQPDRAVLQFQVFDWAGRPTEARVNLLGETGVRYSRPTTAGRATNHVHVVGTYVASVEVVPSRGRPGPSRTIAVRHLQQSGRYALRVLPNTAASVATSGEVPRADESANSLNAGAESLVKFTAAPPPLYYDPPGRYLGRGDRLSLQGQVVDQAGRPIDALVIVSRRGRPIGHVRTTAARFSLFDLARDEYELVAVLPPDRRGRSYRINIGASTPRVALWVAR